jgi:phospholipase/lecithinase/hemolysin
MNMHDDRAGSFSLSPIRAQALRTSGAGTTAPNLRCVMLRSWPLAVGMLVATLVLSGCLGSSGGTKSGFSVPNPFAASQDNVNNVRVGTLRVFGDSYSVPSYKGTPTWPAFLQSSGIAERTENYAVGGNRAAFGQGRGFFDQVNGWLRTNRPVNDRDLTVAYFGYNDIGAGGNRDGFANARAGYTTSVGLLINAGAASENRRLFLAQIHDWSRNPGINSAFRQQVIDWNNIVAETANSSPNVVAVDLFTVFDRIFARPADYGFANVTTVDAGRASIDALFLDGTHFGPRGQEMIARTFNHYLTRGWDWSNQTAAGAEAVRELSRDLDNGILRLSLAGDDTSSSGLTAYTFGGREGDIWDSRYNLDGAAQLERRAGRGSVDPLFARGDTGGVLLDYRPARKGSGADSRFGLSVARYDGTLNEADFAGSLQTEYVSDAMAVYWQQATAGLLSTTQFSYLQNEFDGRGSDDILGFVVANQGSGDTWSLEQRLSRPTDLGYALVVPWVSLSHESHKLDPARATSLYTSDVTYRGARANEWIGQLGLDLQLAPIRLAEGRSLVLSGSARYLSSLYRDALEVSMVEAAMPGVVQRERYDRDRLDRAGLGLGATLSLSKDLDVSAALAVSSDQGEIDESMSVIAKLRF